ncbi:hypothetical protein AJ80_09871 [Polytolypa hystricis UAMH7299]|uniref:Uncharacterized protein n=1 Tax=Polytolypa hystricis (strain UAMH7299) TaxID=1447883 RepID=A0A2B7WHQ6_POLH7|nr:hypothetical protein AJ80_09871 [Polytolypa hystricis UAMH7299]
MVAGSTMDVCCEASDSDSDYSDDGGLFSDNSCDYDTDATGESSSDDSSSSEDSDDEWDDHKLPPPEHYAAEEANLDPSKLRKRRYKPATSYGIDRVRDHWERWACDQHCGKDGRRRSGIRNISSLETFWKQYSQVYKEDNGNDIDPLIMKQVQDVINLVADEKKLSCKKRPKATMYVKDLAEYLCMLLSMTEMHFLISWEDLSSNIACLCIELTGKFTKVYFSDKDKNTFWLSEIIYNLTLVLSPYIFLLKLLFHAKAFKSPYIQCPEDLYNLGILEDFNEQKISLQDELAEKFLFCQAVCNGEGIQVVYEIKATTASLQNRMKKCSEITGFEYPVGLYNIQRSTGKGWNKSVDISNSLQNLMLQHLKIDTYLKYYLDQNINADVMSIYCKDKLQKVLMNQICSMI